MVGCALISSSRHHQCHHLLLLYTYTQQPVCPQCVFVYWFFIFSKFYQKNKHFRFWIYLACMVNFIFNVFEHYFFNFLYLLLTEALYFGFCMSMWCNEWACQAMHVICDRIIESMESRDTERRKEFIVAWVTFLFVIICSFFFFWKIYVALVGRMVYSPLWIHNYWLYY